MSELWHYLTLTGEPAEQHRPTRSTAPPSTGVTGSPHAPDTPPANTAAAPVDEPLPLDDWPAPDADPPPVEPARGMLDLLGVGIGVANLALATLAGSAPGLSVRVFDARSRVGPGPTPPTCRFGTRVDAIIWAGDHFVVRTARTAHAIRDEAPVEGDGVRATFRARNIVLDVGPARPRFLRPLGDSVVWTGGPWLATDPAITGVLYRQPRGAGAYHHKALLNRIAGSEIFPLAHRPAWTAPGHGHQVARSPS